MKICPKCGTQIADDSAAFCYNCGAPQPKQQPAQQVYCSRCGSPNPSSNNNCRNCAAPLHTASASIQSGQYPPIPTGKPTPPAPATKPSAQDSDKTEIFPGKPTPHPQPQQPFGQPTPQYPRQFAQPHATPFFEENLDEPSKKKYKRNKTLRAIFFCLLIPVGIFFLYCVMSFFVYDVNYNENYSSYSYSESYSVKDTFGMVNGWTYQSYDYDSTNSFSPISKSSAISEYKSHLLLNGLLPSFLGIALCLGFIIPTSLKMKKIRRLYMYGQLPNPKN